MKRSLSALIFLIFALSLARNGISPKDYQRMMGVGINVNWVVFKRVRDEFLRAHDMGINVPAIFKARGFSHVRIRAGDEVFQDEEALRALKIAVDESIEAKLLVVIAYTAKDLRERPDERSIERALEWWRKIAKVFYGKPYTLSYDLIIETSGRIKSYDSILNEFYFKVLKVIRSVDPFRIVFLSPNGTSNPCNLEKLRIPKDDHIMVEWHFYASGPSKHNPEKLWTTGTERERDLVLNKIECALRWSKEHGIPTWVGAWMATNYNKVNKKARFPDGAPAGGEYTLEEMRAFASFVSESLKEAGIPYAVNADTKYFDIENLSWYKSVEGVLNVILDP